jgi:hypothetical protein
MCPTASGNKKLIGYEVKFHEDPYEPKSTVITTFYCAKCYPQIRRGEISKVYDDDDVGGKKLICAACKTVIEV